MKHAENVEGLIRELHDATSAEMDERTVKDMLGVLQESTKGKSALAQQYIWAVVLKSRITKLAAAGLIVVAVGLGINQIMSPGVAWADVMERLAEDIRSAGSMHILFTLHPKGPRPNDAGDDTLVKPISVKGEQWFRRNPIACKVTVEGEQTAYFCEHTWIVLNHRSKTWFEQRVGKEQDAARLYAFFDALVSGDFEKYIGLAGYRVSDAETVGHDAVSGVDTTVYKFAGQPVEEGTDDDQRALRIRCWISDSDGRVVRLHQYTDDSDGPTIACNLIEYEVEIPAGTFDVRIPEGYRRHLTLEERMRTTAPKGLRELKEAYHKARENLPDYRMIVTDEQGTPKYQVARQEKNWRRDFFKDYRLEAQNVQIDPSVDFDALWAQVRELPGEYRESTYMTYYNKAAVGFWPEEGYTDLPRSNYRVLPDYSWTGHVQTLEGVAWPKIENLGSPDAEVVVLPRSEKYPGCIGLRVAYVAGTRRRNDRKPVAVLWMYWIDPSRDYICIRFEQHQRRTAVWENDLTWEPDEPRAPFSADRRGNGFHRYHTTIVEITAVAQSLNVNWYPKERVIQSYSVNERGERIEHPKSTKTEKFYIDMEGLVDPSWFEWPNELPPPRK
ncbi:MAG: hypothetical protein ACYS76_01165 [Planctomycetota bacterium]|jgi:hypothetical protein